MDFSDIKKREGIYQCEFEGTHFLILKTFNGKLYGIYIGTENQNTFSLDSISTNTSYYVADLQDIILSNDSQINFKISPVNYYSKPILPDKKGNVTLPIQLMNNKPVAFRLTYRFFGKITGNKIELDRTADHYFSRFDELIFSRRK